MDFSKPQRPVSQLKADGQEDDVGVFIHDMLKMSDFVYLFRNMRNIVKTNDGKLMKRKKSWFSSEWYEVKFDTPSLIITQSDAPDDDLNKFLMYAITPNAIKLFVEKNRNLFIEPEGGGFLAFDNDGIENKAPFGVEALLKDQMEDNMKIVDFDDEFTTNDGGVTYGVVVNLTRKWIAVVFRGTVGLSDVNTDRNFNLDYDSFFKSQDDVSVPEGKPGTHEGFTSYLTDPKKGIQDGRACIDRIITCVNEEFKNNKDVVGKDFKLFVTGHSLGGGLANLFAFKCAQLKAKNDESVSHLPGKIRAMTFAAPAVGNGDYNKEFQALEKKGVLRHIRIANEGDVVPTNGIFFPLSLAFKGNTHEYVQNGVNFFLRPEKELVIDYGNTKSCASQFYGTGSLPIHGLDEYEKRLHLPENKKFYQQNVEDIYEAACGFSNKE